MPVCRKKTVHAALFVPILIFIYILYISQNMSFNRHKGVRSYRYSMVTIHSSPTTLSAHRKRNKSTLPDEIVVLSGGIESKQIIDEKYNLDFPSKKFDGKDKDRVSSDIGKGAEFLSFLNNVKENSYVKDYVKKVKEVYDDLFYKIYPGTVGVPESPVTPKEKTQFINKINQVGPENTAGGEEEELGVGLSVTSYNLPGCGCSRHYPRVKEHPGFITLRRYSTDHHMAMQRRVKQISSCSEHATARGLKQKVVSYSYFGSTSDIGLYNRYFSEIRVRASEIRQLYPDFVMRVYHNVGPEDEKGQREICQAYCDFPHLDFCNVRELPDPWFDFSAKQKVGTMWRFLTLMDPLVDTAMFRDLDSYILPREVAAVSEWLQSDSPYHVMRDHPLHNAQMLAGLWGCQNHLDRGNSYHYGAVMLSQPYSDLWDYDQRLLRRILWPQIRNRTMVHDSYTCKALIFQGQGSTRPFPTKREGQNYTGYGKTKFGATKLLTNCPLACRPPSHKDWVLC